MGCASAKHVATVQNEEEAQKGKSYQNGDVFGDEYRIKPVEEVKYMKNGAEEEQKIAARNQENLEKSASSNARLKTNKEIPGLVHQPRANMHISESQQEFFRMLDEKIEKLDNYGVGSIVVVPHDSQAPAPPGKWVEITVRKKKISHSTNLTLKPGATTVYIADTPGEIFAKVGPLQGTAL